MAKKLEEHLYRTAHTKEEYVDPASLKRRLHLIAKGVGIGIPGEGDGLTTPTSVPGDGGNGVGQSIGGSGGTSNVPSTGTNSTAPSQMPVPLEAVSQGFSGNSEVVTGTAAVQRPRDHRRCL